MMTQTIDPRIEEAVKKVRSSRSFAAKQGHLYQLVNLMPLSGVMKKFARSRIQFDEALDSSESYSAERNEIRAGISYSNARTIANSWRKAVSSGIVPKQYNSHVEMMDQSLFEAHRKLVEGGIRLA